MIPLHLYEGSSSIVIGKFVKVLVFDSNNWKNVSKALKNDTYPSH